MNQLHFSLLIISYVICFVSGSDLILLLQRTGLYKYNLTCVASEESSKFALLWTIYDAEHTNVQQDGSDNYIDKFDTGYFTSNSLRTSISRSLAYNLPGVIDRRWEDFKFIHKYTLGQNLHHNTFDLYTGNASVINISILLKQYMILQLKTDDGIFCVEIRKHINKERFTTCEMIATFFLYSGDESDYSQEWKHFSLYKENGYYILESSLGSDEREQLDEFGLRALTIISESASIWKVHDYKFLSIDQGVSTQVFANFIRKPSMYDNICIAFYLFMENNNCQVAVTLCNTKCRRVYAIKTFSNGGKWSEERIYLNDSYPQDKVHIFVKKSSNCSFAAVDDFKHCPLNKYRVLNLQTDNYEIGCLNLSKENSTVHYKPPGIKKELSRGEEFSNVFQGGKQVICNHENCYCSKGFKGDWCDEDPVTTIRTENVAATSATVYFKTDSYYTWLQINLNGITLNNITVNGYFYRHQFLNLTPNTTYICMARFCSSTTCTRYTHHNLTTSPCTALTSDNVQVMSSISSFTLKLINFDNYTCPPYFFEITNGTVSRILQNHTVFVNNYVITVELIPRYMGYTNLPNYYDGYSFDVSAQTMYTVPDEVENIRITSTSPTEVLVNFDPPLEKQFIKEYIVSYQRISSACGNLHSKPMVYKSNFSNNSFTLSDLQPYSTYNLSIRAVNSEGISPVQTYEFKTLHTENISNEEMFIDLSETSWQFPPCEIMKGPLEYQVIAKCLEKWCLGHSNTIHFEIYKHINIANKFIHDLPSYTRYKITAMISRNGTAGYNHIKDFTIFTPPGKPHPVTDLKVYTKSENSLGLKFKPPFPPTGVTEYDIAVCYFEICEDTKIVRNCTLWDDFLCADIDNLRPLREYSITVWAKNQNVSDKSKVTTQVLLEQTAPEPPTFLLAIHNNNCTIQLQWGHPDATNGPLKFFRVTIRDVESGYIKTVDISTDKESKTYKTELHDLQYSKAYEAYVQAFNPFEGEKSDIVKLEMCSITTTIAWVAISAALLFLILLIVATVLLILKCRKKCKKDDNIHLYDPLELQALRRNREAMVFPKQEFSAEIERNLNFDRYENNILNEYVHLPDTTINVDDIITVKGMNGYDTYISCRSPTASKINAFWDSVWEHNVNVIICHQTLEETKNSGKKYWPEDDETFTTEAINIVCESVQIFCDFFVRNLKLAKVGEDSRDVKHVNYILYPPNDIPTFPFSYLIFLSYIKSLHYVNHKMMVHCSDGANRTGVFIMCYDFLHTQTDVVNVPHFLDEMRKGNPLFINKIIHYKFVYFVIHEVVRGWLTGVPENTFMRHYDVLCRQKLKEEFNYIQQTKFVYSLLRSTVPEEPYKIETACVIGYQGKTTYWTTRYLGMTKKNLWRYVKERDIKVIVMLQDMNERRKNIWPVNTNDQVSCRGIKVNMDSCLDQHCYKLKLTANGETSDILLLYFQDWSGNSIVPPNCEAFYAFYNFYTTIKTGKDILLCCENGFTACGIFLGFDLVFQKVKFEHVFDLCWAVRSINLKNNIFLDNIDQHKFIYLAILYYLENKQTETEDSETTYEPINFVNRNEYDQYDRVIYVS